MQEQREGVSSPVSLVLMMVNSIWQCLILLVLAHHSWSFLILFPHALSVQLVTTFERKLVEFLWFLLYVSLFFLFIMYSLFCFTKVLLRPAIVLIGYSNRQDSGQ